MDPVRKILGKRIDASKNSRDRPYEKRLFEDEVTGIKVYGSELKANRKNTVGKKSEYAVTKHLKKGETGFFEMKDDEYSPDEHIADYANYKRKR